jgi:hypothetical protein
MSHLSLLKPEYTHDPKYSGSLPHDPPASGGHRYYERFVRSKTAETRTLQVKKVYTAGIGKVCSWL